jgi:hypothetical protein
MLPVKLVYAALHNEISKLEELKKHGVFSTKTKRLITNESMCSGQCAKVIALIANQDWTPDKSETPT